MFYVKKYTNDWLKQNENFAESLQKLYFSNWTDIKFYFGSSTEYSLKDLLLRLKMDFKVDGDRRTGEECEYDAMFQISKYTEQVGIGETKGSSSSATNESTWEMTSTSTAIDRYATSTSDEDKEDEEAYGICKEFVVNDASSTNANWIKDMSLSTCTSDVVQVKQETDTWTYEAMRKNDFDNFIENKFRCMETKLCKRCCPKDCFEAFKNVYKRMRKV